MSRMETEEKKADEVSIQTGVDRSGRVKKWTEKKENLKRFKNDRNAEIELKLDSTKRPEFKIALLCGPPGLGKTTLAHIIAKHCGYNVLELNAR